MRLTTRNIRAWASPFVAAICLVTVGQIYVSQHRQANAAQALTSQRGSLAGDVDTLRTQVTYCRQHPRAAYCRQPAAPDPSVRIKQHPAKPVIVIGQPGDAGPAGPRGERGPAVAAQQTRDAVAKYLALHPVLAGRDGTPGSPGPAPPCLSSPSGCAGPVGPVGPKGDTGNRGDRGDQGPVGPAGKDGTDGRDGTGIASVRIDPDTCHMIVTYTSGRTEDAGRVTCPAPATPDASPGTP